jgi:hypothetical protein
VPFKAEAVEQRLLRRLPLAHHPLVSPTQGNAESGSRHIFKAEFFNSIDPSRTLHRVNRNVRSWP